MSVENDNLLRLFYRNVDSFSNLIKESFSQPVPNMAGASPYYAIIPPGREGEVKIGDIKELEGFQRYKVIPFYTVRTPVNGYEYYLCGLRSDKSKQFVIKSPAVWTSHQRGHGTNWAEVWHSLLDRKLADFTKWQFGTESGYVIRRIFEQDVDKYNFNWIDKPFPGTNLPVRLLGDVSEEEKPEENLAPNQKRKGNAIITYNGRTPRFTNISPQEKTKIAQGVKAFLIDKYGYNNVISNIGGREEYKPSFRERAKVMEERLMEKLSK